MNAKLLGMTHRRKGYSIHYNPYRNKSQADAAKWLEGYNSKSEYAAQWLR